MSDTLATISVEQLNNAVSRIVNAASMGTAIVPPPPPQILTSPSPQILAPPQPLSLSFAAANAPVQTGISFNTSNQGNFIINFII